MAVLVALGSLSLASADEANFEAERFEANLESYLEADAERSFSEERTANCDADCFTFSNFNECIAFQKSWCYG